MCINQSNNGKSKITKSTSSATATQKKHGHMHHLNNGMNDIIIDNNTTTNTITSRHNRSSHYECTSHSKGYKSTQIKNNKSTITKTSCPTFTGN
jgi:hypothetical protein